MRAIWLFVTLLPSLASCAAPFAATNDCPPVVLGRAVQDFNGDGRNDVLSLVWMGGRRFVDEDLWCGAGEKYTGQFVFRVAFAGGATVDTTFESLGLNDVFEFFRAWSDQPWPIVTADYNHDGRLDFNVGSYGSCINSAFCLFTVLPAGRVAPLRIEGANVLVLAPPDENSTDAFELTAAGFCYEDYRRRTPEKDKDFKVSLDWDASRRLFRIREEKLELDKEPHQESPALAPN